MFRSYFGLATLVHVPNARSVHLTLGEERCDEASFVLCDFVPDLGMLVQSLFVRVGQLELEFGEKVEKLFTFFLCRGSRLLARAAAF